MTPTRRTHPRRQTRILALVAAVAALAVLAGVPIARAAADPANDTLTGFVGTSEDSADAIAGIRVQLVQTFNPGMVYREAYTAESGYYTIEDVEPGEYFVRFTDPNGVYAIEFWGQPNDGAFEANVGSPLHATAHPFFGGGQTPGGVNAILEPGGVLNGILTQGDGSPAPRVCIGIFEPGTGFAVDRLVTTGLTDDAGTWATEPLAPTPHVIGTMDCNNTGVTMEAFEDAADWASATPVTPIVGAAVSTDMEVWAAGTITGVVTDATTGEPFVDTTGLCAVGWNAGFDAPASTAVVGADGTYSLLTSGPTYVAAGRCMSATDVSTFEWYDAADGVPLTAPDGFHATPEADGALVVNGGTGWAIDDIDIPLGPAAPDPDPPATGTITGTVTDDATGLPIEGIRVEATMSAVTGNVIASALTDATGGYVLGPIDPGSYPLRFVDPRLEYATEFSVDALYASDASPVTVSANATVAMDAALARGGTVSGVVTEAATGSPLANVCVVAMEPGVAGAAHVVVVTNTDADGAYALGALADAPYMLVFNDCMETSRGFAIELYNNTRDLDEATLITPVVDANTSGIDAALEAAGVVSGRILDADGDLLDDYSGWCVIAYHAEYNAFVGQWGVADDGTYAAYGFGDTYLGAGNCEAGTGAEWYTAAGGAPITGPNAFLFDPASDGAETLSVPIGSSVTDIDFRIGELGAPPTTTAAPVTTQPTTTAAPTTTIAPQTEPTTTAAPTTAPSTTGPIATAPVTTAPQSGGAATPTTTAGKVGGTATVPLGTSTPTGSLPFTGTGWDLAWFGSMLALAGAILVLVSTRRREQATGQISARR